MTQSKDGKETVHKGEVLVLATGYDTRWVPSFELKGLNGHVIQRDWEDYAVSYHSLMVAHYPNMFFSLGPNAPLGSNSALPILERTVKYIYRNVLAMRAYSIRSVVPKEEVQNEWFEWAQQWLSTTVWASRGCGGWYKKPKRKGLSHEVADGELSKMIERGFVLVLTPCILQEPASSKPFTRVRPTASFALSPTFTGTT